MSFIRKSSGGAKKKQTVDKTSFKEKISSSEERKQNVSDIGERSSGVAKETVYQVGVESIKEKVSSSEVRKQNIPSATRKISCGADKDTVLQVEMTSTKKEVSSPEERKLNVVSATEKNSSGVAKDKVSQVNVASQKEIVPSPEEREPSVLSTMKKNSSGVDKDTVLQADVASTKEEVPSLEEVKRNVPSSMGKSAPDLRKDTVFEIGTVSNKEEVPFLEEIKRNVISLTEKSAPDLGKDTIFQTDDVASTKEEVPSPEEIKRNILSAMGESFSDIAKDTAVEVDVASTKEKVPSPEEIKRNVTSAMRESFSQENVLTVEKEDTSSPGKEVASPVHEEKASMEKSDSPTNEASMTSDETKNYEEITSEYETISMPKVQSLNDDDVSTKENTVADDSDSDVFEIQLEDNVVVERTSVEEEKKMPEVANKRLEMKKPRKTLVADILKESCASQESIIVLDRNADSMVVTSDSNDRVQQPKERDILGSLEEKIDNISMAINRISERFKAQQEENAKWEESLQNLPIHIPDFSKLDWKIPSFTEVAEEAGQQAASAVVESAEALVTSMETQRSGCGSDIIIESLVNLVISEPFRENLSSSIAGSLKETLTECMSELVTSRYLPIFNKAHQEMTQQLNESIKRTFAELNKRVASHKVPAKTFKRKLNVSFSKDVHASSSTYSPQSPETSRIGADSNQIVEDISNTMKQILEKEFAEWRKNVVESLSSTNLSTQETDTQTYEEIPPDRMPNSPPQPAHPSRPLMDQLMRAAEINSMINSGDINGAFEKALSESDLALVMTACRAANPEVVFAQPTPLKQHVLLSLIQQLATDMVHETQLKCRYLEEALIHLDNENPMIQKHLFTVAEQVKTNISAFLNLYPGHMCGRKLRLIMMAADSFITQPSTDEA